MQLPAPAASERGAILKHEIQRRSLQCHDDILLDVASKCDGYDAYDLVFCFFSGVYIFLPSIFFHTLKGHKCLFFSL